MPSARASIVVLVLVSACQSRAHIELFPLPAAEIGEGGSASTAGAPAGGAPDSGPDCDCSEAPCPAAGEKLLRFHYDRFGALMSWPSTLQIGPERTFEGWLYLVTTDAHLLLNKLKGGSEDVLLRVDANDQVRADVFDGKAFARVTTTTPISAGAWHHLALVQTKAELQLFVDGTSVGSAVSGPPGEKFGNFTLGGGRAPGFDGYWVDVRISSTARYAANFEPERQLESDAETVALWRLDEGSGHNLCDSGPHGIQGLASDLSWETGPARP